MKLSEMLAIADGDIERGLVSGVAAGVGRAVGNTTAGMAGAQEADLNRQTWGQYLTGKVSGAAADAAEAMYPGAGENVRQAAEYTDPVMAYGIDAANPFSLRQRAMATGQAVNEATFGIPEAAQRAQRQAGAAIVEALPASASVERTKIVGDDGSVNLAPLANPKFITERGSEVATQLGLMLATARLAPSATGATALMGLQGFQQAKGQTYNESLKRMLLRGMDPVEAENRAQAGSDIIAAVTASLDAIGGRGFLNTPAGDAAMNVATKSLMRRIGESAGDIGVEAITEAAQEGVSTAGRYYAEADPLAAQGLGDRVIQSGFLGAIGGTVGEGIQYATTPGQNVQNAPLNAANPAQPALESAPQPAPTTPESAPEPAPAAQEPPSEPPPSQEIPETPQAEPVVQGEVVDDADQFIERDGKRLRVTVSGVNADDGWHVKRIKLHDDSTGSYEIVDFPDEAARGFASPEEANREVIERVKERFQQPKQISVEPRLNLTTGGPPTAAEIALRGELTTGQPLDVEAMTAKERNDRSFKRKLSDAEIQAIREREAREAAQAANQTLAPEQEAFLEPPTRPIAQDATPVAETQALEPAPTPEPVATPPAGQNVLSALSPSEVEKIWRAETGSKRLAPAKSTMISELEALRSVPETEAPKKSFSDAKRSTVVVSKPPVEKVSPTYQQAQDAIDDFTDAMIAKHGKEAINAPPRDYGDSQKYLPPHPLSEAELAELQRLYRVRDGIEQADADSVAEAGEEIFAPLIPDPEKRRRFVRKITKADDQLGRFIKAKNEDGTSADRDVGKMANAILKYIDLPKNVPQAAYFVDVERTPEGPRLRLTAEPGLGPLPESLNEAQRWLSHIYGDKAPVVPGAKRPAGQNVPQAPQDAPGATQAALPAPEPSKAETQPESVPEAPKKRGLATKFEEEVAALIQQAKDDPDTDAEGMSDDALREEALRNIVDMDRDMGGAFLGKNAILPRYNNPESQKKAEAELAALKKQEKEWLTIYNSAKKELKAREKATQERQRIEDEKAAGEVIALNNTDEELGLKPKKKGLSPADYKPAVVSPRGQTALPGLEEEAAAMEKRDAEGAAVLAELGTLRKFGDDFVLAHKPAVDLLRKKIAEDKTTIHGDDFIDQDIEDLLPETDDYDAVAEQKLAMSKIAEREVERATPDISKTVEDTFSTPLDKADPVADLRKRSLELARPVVDEADYKALEEQLADENEAERILDKTRDLIDGYRVNGHREIDRRERVKAFQQQIDSATEAENEAFEEESGVKTVDDLRKELRSKWDAIDAALEARTKELGRQKADLKRGRRKNKTQLLADIEREWQSAKESASAEKQAIQRDIMAKVEAMPDYQAQQKKDAAAYVAKRAEEEKAVKDAEERADKDDWQRVQDAGGYEKASSDLDKDLRKAKTRLKMLKESNKWKAEQEIERAERNKARLDLLNSKFATKNETASLVSPPSETPPESEKGQNVQNEAPAPEPTPEAPKPKDLRPTGIMEKYRVAKKEAGDAVTVMRVGDFYELFDADATLAAKQLGLTLTKRGDTPMAGFPYHVLDSYISKLVANGNRVAVVEGADVSVNEPKAAKDAGKAQEGVAKEAELGTSRPWRELADEVVASAKGDPNVIDGSLITQGGEKWGAHWMDSDNFKLMDVPLDKIDWKSKGEKVAGRSKTSGPIVIDKNGRGRVGVDPETIVLDGQHRLEEARQRGDKTIRAWVGDKAADKLLDKAIDRTTPRKGTPEREAMDAAKQKWSDDHSAAYEAVTEQRKVVDKAKWGSKKREQAEKKLEKLREKLGEVNQREDKTRNLPYYEDRIEEASDEYSRAFAVEQYNQFVRGIGGKPLPEQGSAYEKAKAAATKYAKDRGLDDEAASSVGFNTTQYMHAFPMRGETLNGIAEGYVQSYEAETPYRKALEELDAIEHMAGRSDIRRKLDTYKREPERINAVMEEARALDKQRKDAEKLEKQASAKAAKERARSLKPLDPKGSTKGDAWGGNVLGEKNAVVSDGSVMVDTSAIDSVNAKSLEKNGERSNVRAPRVQEIWDGAVANASEDASPLGADNDYAYFRSGDKVEAITLPRAKYFTRIGKTDSYKFSKSGKGTGANSLLVAYRDGKPVWVSTTLEGQTPALDLAELDKMSKTASQQAQEEAKPSLTKDPRSVGISGGTVDISKPAERLYKKGVSTLKRLFLSAGHLPKEVFDAALRMNAQISEHAHKAEFYATALRDALIAVEGTDKLTDGGRKLLKDALQGNQAALRKLPSEVVSALSNLRLHVDALSQALIDAGLVDEDLEITIEQNMGTYLNRSFQVFDDPNWKDKVEESVKEDARDWFRQEYPAWTDRQVEHAIEMLLDRKNSPVSLILGRKLGSKDTSIFKRRKDIPEQIRKLMGEYDDPLLNYHRSILKMSHLVAKHKFLSDVREMGMGKFLFEADDPNIPEGFTRPIAAEGSSVMSPLNGLLTTPEIEAAFSEAMSNEKMSGMMRHYMKAVVLTKFGKTVLSPQTHVRNWLGNVDTAIANGHWRAGKMKESWKAAAQVIRPKIHGKLRPFIGVDQDAQDLAVEAAKYGVTSAGSSAGELKMALKEAFDRDLDAIGANQLEKIVRGTAGLAATSYQLGDSTWKIYGWLNEIARYKEAYDKAGVSISDEDLKREAADIIGDTYHNYDKVPRAVRAIGRTLLVGDFVSFASETFRVRANSMALAVKEMRNPVTRKIGIERMAGFILSASIPTMLAMAGRAYMGMDEEDENDLRNSGFLPEWQRNSDILWIGGGDGKLRFADISYLFPSAYIRDPIFAMLRHWKEDGLYEGVKQGTWELTDPFLSEGILTGALIDIKRNQTREGYEVYPESATDNEKLVAMAKHVAWKTAPGFVPQTDRVAKGFTGHVEPWGQSYDPLTEMGGIVSGTRAQEIDLNEKLSSASRSYARNKPKDSELFTKIVGRRGTVTPEEIKQGYASTERARRESFEALQGSARAAMKHGLSREQVEASLGGGLSKNETAQILAGIYIPYSMSDQLYERIRSTPDAKERLTAYWDAWKESGAISSLLTAHDEAKDEDVKALLQERILEVAKDIVQLPGGEDMIEPEHPAMKLAIKKALGALNRKAGGEGKPSKQGHETDTAFQDRKEEWQAEKDAAKERMGLAPIKKAWENIVSSS